LFYVQLKEFISSVFTTTMRDEDFKCCMKVQDLVVQVVQALVSTSSGSQDTLKINSSEEGSCNDAMKSVSTEKLPSFEGDCEYDCDGTGFLTFVSFLLVYLFFSAFYWSSDFHFMCFCINSRCLSAKEKEMHRSEN
jgi:hypothetical protein